MDIIEKNSIGHFLFYVNSLLDAGYKEEIIVIEKVITEERIVEYIGNKYSRLIDFTPFEVNGPYSIETVNSLFASYLIEGNEKRKYAMQHNGLCLIIAMGLDIIIDQA